jgi:hypothetical protein
MDISAVTGTLGAMARLLPDLRLGLCVRLPEEFTLSGTGLDDVTRVQLSPRDTLIDYASYDFEDKVSLPFRVSTGLSFTPQGVFRNILLTGEMTYADWQQIDYAGPIRMENRRYAYRSTIDWRMGAEYSFPRIPLRLRAGFVSEPLPYKPIGTDVYNGGYVQANLKQDRRYFTVGGGILLDRSLSLDLAYAAGGYERAGRSRAGETVEKVTDHRLYLGAAFRL